MSDSKQLQAEHQAMQWQARLSSDLIDEGQRREFDAWLAESPENVAAWRSVNAFWSDLDKVRLDDIVDSADAAVLLFPLSKRKPKSRFGKTALALAASLLLAVGFGYRHLDYYLADYRTDTGQQQLVILSDGSTVQLNTASAISMTFSGEQRLVTLHRGEAYFKVSPDRTRPFIVKTAAGEVQALGTAFDVKLLNQDQASVTVFEHAVQVTTLDGQIKDKLGEAQQVKFTHSDFSQVRTVNLQHAGAWHLQRMVFQDKPLVDVVAELDRYRAGKILILDDEINQLPITGVFDIANTDIALQTIEQSLPVKVKKMTDKLVLLSSK